MKNIFKIASLLAAAVMLFACEEKGGDNEGVGQGEFYMVADKDIIQSNGTDASTIKVFLGDEDVTAEAVIYDEKNNEVSLDGGVFTATSDGEYKFWATYGTYSTYDKNLDDNGLMTIRAISVAVPDVAPEDDANVSKTSFVHRAFLLQYTGIQCGYCPYMIKILKELVADGTIPGKAVLAAAHSGYNSGDPAAITAPKAPGGSYPYLHVNLTQGFAHTNGSAALYSLVNGAVASDAEAGISVNPKLYDDGTLVIKVSVKAAKDGDYKVGAWLLEDGIYATQSDYDNVGDDSYDIHNNCVRIVDSRHAGEWVGKPLGSIKAGNTAEKTFVMDLKKAWKRENLHLAVIVSSKGKSGYTVCNAVDVPIDEPTPFEYK